LSSQSKDTPEKGLQYAPSPETDSLKSNRLLCGAQCGAWLEFARLPGINGSNEVQQFFSSLKSLGANLSAHDSAPSCPYRPTTSTNGRACNAPRRLDFSRCHEATRELLNALRGA
jgi:hypothetical protein